MLERGEGVRAHPLLPSPSRSQLASLQPSAAAQLTQSCVDGTSDSAWSLVTPAIAHALTATQCQAFVSEQLSQFNVTAFAALQPACTGAFTGGLYGACAGLTSNQVRNALWRGTYERRLCHYHQPTNHPLLTLCGHSVPLVPLADGRSKRNGGVRADSVVRRRDRGDLGWFDAHGRSRFHV